MYTDNSFAVGIVGDGWRVALIISGCYCDGNIVLRCFVDTRFKAAQLHVELK